MILGIFEDVFVSEESFDLLHNRRRKVGVLVMDAMDSDHDVANFFEGVFRGEFFGLEEIIFRNVKVMFGSNLLR